MIMKTKHSFATVSHALCQHDQLIKAADHFIYQYQKKKLLWTAAYVMNEYSNANNRKNTLENYFGGLALQMEQPRENINIPGNTMLTKRRDGHNDIESKASDHKSKMTLQLGSLPALDSNPKPKSLYKQRK